MKVTHQFQNITHGPLENNFLNQPRHVIWLTAESAEEHDAINLLAERFGMGPNPHYSRTDTQHRVFSLPLNPTPEKKEFGDAKKPFRSCVMCGNGVPEDSLIQRCFCSSSCMLIWRGTNEKKSETEFVGKELEPFREPIPGKPFPDNGTVNVDIPCPRCNSRIIFIYGRKTVMCANCAFGESSHDDVQISVARLRGKYLEGKRGFDYREFAPK